MEPRYATIRSLRDSSGGAESAGPRPGSRPCCCPARGRSRAPRRRRGRGAGIRPAGDRGMITVMAGRTDDLRDVPIDHRDADDFCRAVYAATRDIPAGTTWTYGEVAGRWGSTAGMAPATSGRHWPATRPRSSSRATASSGPTAGARASRRRAASPRSGGCWSYFGIAEEFGGRCHLRFDDTNPLKEEQEYIDAIEADVRWLGFDWGEHLYHAVRLLRAALRLGGPPDPDGDAYVDDLSADEIREHRGTLTEPGRRQPLPRPLRRGEPRPVRADARRASSPNGARVLRAKIDMASPNINLRDPVLYRISTPASPAPATPGASTRPTTSPTASPTRSRASPTRSARSSSRTTGRSTTGSSSTCRCLRGRARSSSPGSTSPTRCSEAGPAAARRRRATSAAGTTRGCRRSRACAGAASRRGDPRLRDDDRRRQGDSVIEIGAARARRPRRPQPDGAAPVRRPRPAQGRHRRTTPRATVETMDVANNPEDPSAGTREVPFSRELWIERDDFLEEPPPKFFRLAPGREVRLRYAYFITCARSSRTPPARSSSCAAPTTRRRAAATPPTAAGRRRPSTGCRPRHAVPAEVRLYDHLFAARPRRRRRPVRPTSTRRRRRSSPGRWLEPSLAGARSARRSSSSGSATSRPTRTRAGAPRLQPDADAQGHLGEDPGLVGAAPRAGCLGRPSPGPRRRISAGREAGAGRHPLAHPVDPERPPVGPVEVPRDEVPALARVDDPVRLDPPAATPRPAVGVVEPQRPVLAGDSGQLGEDGRVDRRAGRPRRTWTVTPWSWRTWRRSRGGRTCSSLASARSDVSSIPVTAPAVAVRRPIATATGLVVVEQERRHRRPGLQPVAADRARASRAPGTRARAAARCRCGSSAG